MHILEEASRCLLCADAPCTKACIHYDFPIRIREMVKELPDAPGGPGSSGPSVLDAISAGLYALSGLFRRQRG